MVRLFGRTGTTELPNPAAGGERPNVFCELFDEFQFYTVRDQFSLVSDGDPGRLRVTSVPTPGGANAPVYTKFDAMWIDPLHLAVLYMQTLTHFGLWHAHAHIPPVGYPLPCSLQRVAAVMPFQNDPTHPEALVHPKAAWRDPARAPCAARRPYHAPRNTLGLTPRSPAVCLSCFSKPVQPVAGVAHRRKAG